MEFADVHAVLKVGAVAAVAAAVFVLGRAVVARVNKRPMRVRRLIVSGGFLTLLALADHRATGVVVMLVLLAMCACLGIPPEPTPHDTAVDDAEEPLQRWRSRTEALVHWSDTTRSDWDRRVRPVLARHFEVATKADQRRATNPAAFQTTGQMLFGDLWQWVDPDNVVRGGSSQRGPGRRTLEQIVERLEQV